MSVFMCERERVYVRERGRERGGGGFEAVSCLWPMFLYITQLLAQWPARTCITVNTEEEGEGSPAADTTYMYMYICIYVYDIHIHVYKLYINCVDKYICMHIRLNECVCIYQRQSHQQPEVNYQTLFRE